MFSFFHSLSRKHLLLLVPASAAVAVWGADKLFSPSQDAASPQPKVAESIASLVPYTYASTLDQGSINTASAIALANALENHGHSANSPLLDKQTLIAAVTAVRIHSGSKASPSPHARNSKNSDADFDQPRYDAGSDAHPQLADEVQATDNTPSDWRVYTVQSGDSFTGIVSDNLGLGYSDVMHLLQSAPDKTSRQRLVNIRKGSTIAYRKNSDGDILALRVMDDPMHGIELTRDSKAFDFHYENIKGHVTKTQRLYTGVVADSFNASAQASGLSSSDVVTISQLLSKKFNLHAKASKGDRFQVLMEIDMVRGAPVSTHPLAIRYQGKGIDTTLVRYHDDFYTSDGNSLSPAFARYPFKGHYPITSPFNLHRHHPVTGRISPHLGTDFGMPSGTAVLAPAAGRVTQVDYNIYAGKSVVIDHGNNLKTRYLHLSHPQVHVGEQIHKGQQIALSGSTGRVTGPHLHYEIMVDNHPVNPMRIKLPQGGKLKGAQLATFKRTVNPLLARLSPKSGANYAHQSAQQPTDGNG